MKIAVAVSGGTDSLFSLILLKEQGHDVFAVHAFFLPPDDKAHETVAGLQSRCDALGVPLHVLDLHKEFQQQVIDPFIAAYATGKTPNPCALCNPTMKFGLLFDRAKALGASHVATGHYARIQGEGADARLIRGTDPVKDQSYFLSLVPQERLAKAIFPLDSWCKTDVRSELEKRGIVPPLPSDSQEICFVPGDDYCAFLEHRSLEPLPGPGKIILEDGSTVGRHNGIWRYTLGQRRGIGVAWKEPLYVIAKNAEDNTLTVGPKSSLPIACCQLREVNILVPQDQWPEKLYAQTHYRQKARPVEVELTDGGLELRFTEAHTRPAPGQIGALYTEDGTVLAGGVISHSCR